MRLPGNDNGARTSANLAAALSGIADARSQAELMEMLHAIMAAHFGAAGVVLLTREPPVASAQRIARLTGGAAPQSVSVPPAAAERLLKAGVAVVTGSPEADLPGAPVPDGTGFAVLVPCSGDGADKGLCGFWTERRDPPASDEIENLRLVAAIAGLAFDRLTAELSARLQRADLENRIRNVLAVVRSVGTRSAERASSLEDFLLHFEGRIDAIGRSQMAASRDGEISFEHLLREELLAQTIQDGECVSLDGLDVQISPEQAEALGLAVHELAVNAIKFGALSAPGGGLNVRWWVEGGAEALTLRIDWREDCGTSVTVRQPEKTGFGLTYLGRALPFQLDAEVGLDFERDGLRCRIAVPLAQRTGLRARNIPDRHDGSHLLSLHGGRGNVGRRAAAGMGKADTGRRE